MTLLVENPERLHLTKEALDMPIGVTDLTVIKRFDVMEVARIDLVRGELFEVPPHTRYFALIGWIELFVVGGGGS